MRGRPPILKVPRQDIAPEIKASACLHGLDPFRTFSEADIVSGLTRRGTPPRAAITSVTVRNRPVLGDQAGKADVALKLGRFDATTSHSGWIDRVIYISK